ncbi:MAG: hypothetical protein AAF591_10485 [Verrucomicrobiota bacterium]
MQLVARKAPSSPANRSSKKKGGSGKKKSESLSKERSQLKATLDDELTPWAPFSSATNPALAATGRNSKSLGAANAIHPSDAQRKLAEAQFKSTLENLLEPKVRLNIAGKEIHSTLKEHDDYEQKIVSLSRDYLGVIIRRINTRIDRILGAKYLRILSARLSGKSQQKDALRQNLPFAVHEFAVVRSDGLLIAHLADKPENAKLPAFLKQESRRIGSDSTSKSSPNRSAFFSRLATFAQTNSSPTDHFILNTGNRSALVAAVQGAPSKKFRRQLALTHRAIEDDLTSEPWLPEVPNRIQDVHLRHLNLLNDFAREQRSAPFPWLQFALVSLTTLPLIAATAAFFHYQSWKQYDQTLANTPGFQIIHSSPWSSPMIIAGLRDPLAPDPHAVLQQAGLNPSKVRLRFTAAPSSEPDFVLARATRALQPSEGLTLTLDQNTLRASGSAPRSWIDAAKLNTPLLFPGLVYDDSGVLDSSLTAPALPTDLAEQLVHQRVFFEEGKTDQPILAAGHMTEVSEIIFQLQDEARRHQLPLEIKIAGRYSIPDKPFDITQLSKARDRAGHIRNLLLALRPGIDPVHFHAIAEHPFAEENTNLTRLNRAIEFQVTLDGQDISPPPLISE